MAISGQWKTRASLEYANVNKNGNGWNPIHAVRGGDGRNTAPGAVIPGSNSDILDYSIDDDDYTYGGSVSPEDDPSSIWGAGTDTGTSDRPAWGDDASAERVATTDRWPAWGRYKAGRPGGNAVRSYNHGMTEHKESKVVPTYETATASDWDNKAKGETLDAQTSDQSQYEMQTSMTQRNKVRDGSQTERANADRSPIESRTVGMKIKTWAGGMRHRDMEPRSQDVILRPFYNRTAGTGDPARMRVNELYVSSPVQRTAPALPDPGQPVETGAYGYTLEDQQVYY